RGIGDQIRIDGNRCVSDDVERLNGAIYLAAIVYTDAIFSGSNLIEAKIGIGRNDIINKRFSKRPGIDIAFGTILVCVVGGIDRAAIRAINGISPAGLGDRCLAVPAQG
ncbi:MAG: hypothetical protein AAGA01_02895, partial [Cyanobacteria bacterium P01_E01_bin.43]